MEKRLPLILAVEGLAYSGGETFELLKLCLDKAGFKADLQNVPFTEVVETARRLQPALIIIGHRPLLDDAAMRERWEAAGSPMGGDIIKTLKSGFDTRDIPVLLIEAYLDMESLAQEYGADGFVQVPAGPEIAEAVRSLIEKTQPMTANRDGDKQVLKHS